MIPVCSDSNPVLSFVNQKIYDLKILSELSGRKLEISSKINAHLKSYKIAGIDVSKYKFSSLFPNWEQIQIARAERIEKLFEQVDPDISNFYDHLFPFVKHLYTKINNQILITDLYPNKINFYATGAKDGRLTIKKGFLNILTLPKEERHRIQCESDCRFVQFDYRSFQPRLAIFFTKNEKFISRFADREDMYDTPGVDRAKQKLKFFQIMYGTESSDQLDLRPIFELRKQIFEEISTKGKIISPFGRPIYFNNEPEHVVFRNYITTCEADFVFNVTVLVAKLLEKSQIKWLLHDSIMFEIHKSEVSKIKQIKKVMEESQFNIRFPVSISTGKNFGELRLLPWHRSMQ